MLLATDLPWTKAVFNVVPICDWATSVYVLCLAHVFHAAYVFGWYFSCQYGLIGLGVVFAMEEIGLQTGVVFGDYFFTSNLGLFATSHLPVIVPFLWFSLSYPIFVWTVVLIKEKNISRNGHAKSVLFASIFLTAYDTVSDPIGVLYGNKMWHHAAFVDSATSLQSYSPQPDWVFSSSTKKSFLLQVLSFPCHFGIPFHNFLGWFITSLVMYSGIFIRTPPLPIIFSRSALRFSSKARLPLDLDTLAAALFLFSPVISGLICTQCFYLLHPCHPELVRHCSLFYLLIVLATSYLLY